jgi:acyl dehydratase
MHSELIGEKHDHFLAKRQGKAFDGSSKEDNTHRGVRSGIRRKTTAINDRVFTGAPTDRNGVDRDRRAAKYLVMVLGAVFTDQESINNTIKDGKRLGKALRVARAIWLREAYRRKESGQHMSINDMYLAHYTEGLRQIRIITEESVNDFETVLICFETILGQIATEWDRAQWTAEEENIAASTGKFPCYFENAQFEGFIPERKRTNLFNDSIDSLIYSLKQIVKAAIKDKAYKHGWKTCKRVMAMCLQALEKKTLAGIMNAQRYLTNFMAGKTLFGSRKPSNTAPEPTISGQEATLLHGAARAKQDFLGMPFHLAIFRIKTGQ